MSVILKAMLVIFIYLFICKDDAFLYLVNDYFYSLLTNWAESCFEKIIYVKFMEIVPDSGYCTLSSQLELWGSDIPWTTVFHTAISKLVFFLIYLLFSINHHNLTRYREIKLKTVIHYFSLLAILRYTTMLLVNG